MDQTTKKHPIWREATAQIIMDFSYGDTISLKWFEKRLELEKPKQASFVTYNEYSLKWLTAIEALKRELLENHNMALKNIRGEGYIIVHPADQTKFAMEDMGRLFKKAAIKTARRLKFVDSKRLNDEQIRENSEAIGRLAALKAFSKKQIAIK